MVKVESHDLLKNMLLPFCRSFCFILTGCANFLAGELKFCSDNCLGGYYGFAFPD